MIDNRELFIEAWALVDTWLGVGDLAPDEQTLSHLAADIEDSLRKFYDRGYEAGRVQGRLEAQTKHD